MKKLKTLLLLSIISVSIVSCEESNLEGKEVSVNEREVFVNGKSRQEQKSAFQNLSSEEQKSLWESKIDHVISTEITEQQHEILSKLKKSIANNVSFEDLKNDDNFKTLMLEIAKSIDYDDFTKMFLSLESFPKYSKANYSSEDSEFLVEKVKSSFNNAKVYTTTNQSTEEKEDCNCSWTCDDDSPLYTTDCESSSMGCGFLFLFSCKIYS